jgi:hypothetical protein
LLTSTENHAAIGEHNFPAQWALDYFAKEHPEFDLHPVSPHEMEK